MKAAPKCAMIAVAALAVASMVLAEPAFAHGEDTEQPWLRNLSATFFDVSYSGQNLKPAPEWDGYVIDVGDTFELVGKLQVSQIWPITLGEPKLGYLAVNMPGPALAIQDKQINGVFVPGSFALQRGESFEFKLTLAGRRPGRWHIHPRLDVKGTGPLIGRGVWVTVRGGQGYHRTVALASGERIDLEKYGLGRIFGWHALWFVIALAWSVFWLRKHLFQRLISIDRFGPDSQTWLSRRDKGFTAVTGALVLGLIVGGANYAGRKWDMIPLQVRREALPTLAVPEFALATAKRAVYDRGHDRLDITVEFKNQSTAPLSFERLVMGPVSFATDEFFDPARDQGAFLSPVTTIPPGTSSVTLTVESKVLEEEKLISTGGSAVLQTGGLLVFRDSAGQRSWMFVAADLLPG